MRPRSGPADLRNSKLNRGTDTRELMRPRPGPSDLRYSNLQPNKELREIMKPKPLSIPEEGEVESSEDELPPEEELKNVLFSENEINFSNPVSGPDQTKPKYLVHQEKTNPERKNKPKRNHHQSSTQEPTNGHTVAMIFP